MILNTISYYYYIYKAHKLIKLTYTYIFICCRTIIVQKLFSKSFLKYIRVKDSDITKTEYVKTLKNRSKSIKQFTSKHETLKLIDNLTKKYHSYLSKLRNIKLNDEDHSAKTIINTLAKGFHKKRLAAVFQQLHKKILFKRFSDMLKN